MLLTALAVVVGASVILAAPIFQGLAIALMAGEMRNRLPAHQPHGRSRSVLLPGPRDRTQVWRIRVLILWPWHGGGFSGAGAGWQSAIGQTRPSVL